MDDALGELKGNCVSDVHAVAARPTPSVEVKWLPLFIAIKNQVQVTVAEDNSSAHKSMRPTSSYSFEALKQFFGYTSRSKFPNQFIIVNGEKLARLVDTTRHIERSHNLSDCLGRGGLLGQAQCGESGGLSRFIGHV